MNYFKWISGAIILGALLYVTFGCAPKPYTVCRGEVYCTPPLTHDEAIQAAQLKKAWEDSQLYVRPTGR